MTTPVQHHPQLSMVSDFVMDAAGHVKYPAQLRPHEAVLTWPTFVAVPHDKLGTTATVYTLGRAPRWVGNASWPT
jgi:hypothetical protein